MKTRLQQLFASPKPGMLLIGILFFLLYLTTAPRVNVGYADSDELLAVGYNLGVAHPPGYPLYVFLIFIFTHLPFSATVAFKGHLLSALLSSGALAITFHTIWRVTTDILQKNNLSKEPIISKQNDTFFISFLSTSLLGVSLLYWVYSQVTEVFALNNLFAAAIIALLTHTILNPKPVSDKFWILTAALFGLAGSHHQSIVLLAPVWLVALFLHRQSFRIHLLIRMAAAVLLGFFLPYALIFLYLKLNPSISWYMDPSFTGLVHLILRKEFSGLIPETGRVTSAYLPPVSVRQILTVAPIYARYLLTFFGYAVGLIGLLGAKHLFDKKPSYAIAILGGFLLAGPFFAGLMNWPVNVGLQASIHRQYLLGFMFIPILVAAGWYMLLHRLRLTLSALFENYRLSVAAVLLLSLGTLAWRTYTQYPLANMRNYTMIADRYGAMIDSLQPNALIACFSDTSCFALLYEQHVNHKRPDVTVLPRAMPLVSQKLASMPELRGYTYAENPYLTYDYITWNIDQRPVYVTDLSELYYRLLGMNEGFLYYVSHGFYGQLVKNVPLEQPPTNYHYDASYLATHTPPADLMRLWYKGNIIRTHIFNSIILVKSGYRDHARNELNSASNLQYQLPPEFGSIEEARKQIEQSTIVDVFKPGHQALSAAEFHNLYEQWFEQKKYDIAYRVALGSTTVYPRDATARLDLAEAYEFLGDSQLARLEYRHTLMIDPNNELAKQKLAELQSR